MQDIEKTLYDVIEPSGFEIGMDEVEMIMVLVYEAAIKGQRLRMGGRVVKMVKSNVNELKQILSGG